MHLTSPVGCATLDRAKEVIVSGVAYFRMAL